MAARFAAVSMAIAITVLAACAPPAPPVAPAPGHSAVPATTAPAPVLPLTSLYKRFGPKARSSYSLTFSSGTPQHVVDSFWAAAAAVSSISGITFASGIASDGKKSADGELRVQIGTLCGGTEPSEAGCAIARGMGDRLMSADISVGSIAAASSYLDHVSLHELGHSVGLDHVAFRADAPQIMNPVVNLKIKVYQAGDREGLRLIGVDKYNPNSSMAFAPLMVPTSEAHAVLAPR